MYLTTINLYISFSFIILATRWKVIEIEISSEVCTTYIAIKNVSINICIFIHHTKIHRIISLTQFFLCVSIGILSQKKKKIQKAAKGFIIGIMRKCSSEQMIIE